MVVWHNINDNLFSQVLLIWHIAQILVYIVLYNLNDRHLMHIGICLVDARPIDWDTTHNDINLDYQ